MKGTEFPGDFTRTWKGKPEDLQYYLIVRVQRANMVPLSSSAASSSVLSSCEITPFSVFDEYLIPFLASLSSGSSIAPAVPQSPRGAANAAAFVPVGPTVRSGAAERERRTISL